MRGHEAGRELDALVAEAFGFRMDPPCARYHRTDEAEYDSDLGWTGWCYTCGRSVAEVAPEPRRYSADIAAAFEVVEKLNADGFYVAVSCMPNMTAKWDVRGWSDDNRRRFIAHAETAPLAICRAALDAIEAA